MRILRFGSAAAMLIGLAAAPLFGQAVTLTAQVVPALAPGTVSFFYGAPAGQGVDVEFVGAGGVSLSGIAQINTLTLPAGARVLYALYGGGAGGYQRSSAALPYLVKAISGAGFATEANYGAGTGP